MSLLPSLKDGYRAWVFGASGGIGAAIVRRLSADPRCAGVHAGGRTSILAAPRLVPFTFDLRDETSIADAVRSASAEGAPDLVFVATGVLHGSALKPEKSYRAVSGAALAEAFAINATGPALIAKHVLPLLPRERKSVFAALSARVGSIADNRLGGWYSYRASKAALNMLIRTAAIELALRNPQALCLALHPGTVDTPLSKPYQGAVPKEKLFTADVSAGHLLSVIDRATPADSGALIAWDRQGIPF